MTFERLRGLAATALLGTPLSLVAGCAAPVVVEDAGGFRHARHGYRIAAPAPATPPWLRIQVEGSDLAFRRSGPAWMTLSSRCNVPTARPQILARHLRIGIPEHTVRESGAVTSNGIEGWQQVLDARQRGEVVRVKTVTLRLGRCALDAMLSARGPAFEDALPAFEAWWRTLRPAAP